MCSHDHGHSHSHNHAHINGQAEFHSHAAPPAEHIQAPANHCSDAPSQASTLRETQAPLKQSYRADPSSALVTLHSSTGTLDASAITCSLASPNAAAVRSAHARIAGLHPAAGGPDAAASGELCSGDMLLDALVACAGVTFASVAAALGVPVAAGSTVRAEGDLNFAGVLGVDRAAPVGFTGIRLLFEVQLDEADERYAAIQDLEGTVEKLGQLTERYCTVLQTIVHKPDVRVSLAVREGGEDNVERDLRWGRRL